MYAIKQHRKRMILSLFLALTLHAGVFLAFQYLLPELSIEVPEYSGPLVVTLEPEVRPYIPEEKPAPVEKKPEPIYEKTPEPEKVVTEQPVIQRTERTTVPRPAPPPSTAEREAVIETQESYFDYSYSGIITQERTEEAPAPIEEEGIIPPITGRTYQEEEKTSLPFEPSSEIESESLVVDIGHLDKAIEKSQETSVTPDEGKIANAESKENIPASKAPLIEWDDATRTRTLTYAGPPPAIPSWVKKEGLDLKVAVSFAVTSEGHTTSIKIRLSSGYSDVDTAVLDAVRKMKFNADPKSRKVTGTITYIISPK
jgi:TonB family protein